MGMPSGQRHESLRERFAEEELCRLIGQEQGAAVDVPKPSVQMLRRLGRHGLEVSTML